MCFYKMNVNLINSIIYFCYYLRLCVIKYQGMLLDLILYSNINKFIMNIFIEYRTFIRKIIILLSTFN